MRTADPALVPAVEGWELTRLLGVGGQAQVWHGVPLGGGEPAAVKLVPLAGGTAPGAAAAEAALLAGLDHEHLVRLREVLPVRWPDSDRPGLALVLDLAAAGSLADLLRRRGRLAPGEVVTAVAPVALALAHVHEQAFVHGDVTPANLLFSAEGVPLLADLGVAKVVGGYGEVRTTAAYADPAVAAGGRPSTGSDVFMLAATAFHALTGAPPWPDPLPGVALARAARGDVGPLHTALDAVPGAVADVVREGLRPEPHLRPTAAEFALDLGRAARPLPVDFDAGRAVAADGSQLAVWTGSPLPTGERETHAVEPVPVPADAVPARRSRHAAGAGPPRRRVLLAAVVSVAVAVVVVAGGVVFRGGTAGSTTDGSAAGSGAVAPTHATSAAAKPTGWGDVLADLDATRAAAFARGDPALLARVYVPGPLLSADRTTLAAQVPTGCSLHGATTTYSAVAAGSAPADRPTTVTVRATAVLAPSVLACPGRPAVPVDGIAATPVAVTLTRTGDGYRIAGLVVG